MPAGPIANVTFRRAALCAGPPCQPPAAAQLALLPGSVHRGRGGQWQSPLSQEWMFYAYKATEGLVQETTALTPALFCPVVLTLG